MGKPAEVPIPARMSHLPVDARGYPVPVIVMRAPDGEPLFAGNDEGMRQRMIEEDRCQICGGKLLRGRWFVGGHLCACAEAGVFMDTPMHDECAHYALQVCPYLAAPRYNHLVGRGQLAKRGLSDIIVLDDPTEHNQRPTVFVALMAVGMEDRRRQPMVPNLDLEHVRFVKPKPGTVRRVEVWWRGKLVTQAELLERIWSMVEGHLVEIGDHGRADVFELIGRPRP